MSETLYIIIIIALLLLAIIVLPNVLTKRAMRLVIKTFRDNNALSNRTAKSIKQLKLEPRSFLMNMIMPRDYKQRAMQYLMKANIIRTTDDGRVYLSQETLRQYDIENRGR